MGRPTTQELPRLRAAHYNSAMAINGFISSNSDPARDDARADRSTFIWVAVFMAASLTVDILSAGTEINRAHSGFPISKIVIYETSGYAVFLALFPVIAWLASRMTPGQFPWRFIIPFHLGASLLVSAVHISVMVAIRKALFPIVYGHAYIFTDNPLRDFIYEYRKDAFGYALFLFLIIFGRQVAQNRRELAAAREDAKASKKLTLKCGGRAVLAAASEVRWAKSASNYVEVAAGDKIHLARSTLAAIETQLADAGAPAARVHRSYVVNTDHIREIRPTGEGDVKIEMSDGEIIPGSRRYRDRLPGAAASS